jgi:hypothetical protein
VPAPGDEAPAAGWVHHRLPLADGAPCLDGNQTMTPSDVGKLNQLVIPNLLNTNIDGNQTTCSP